MENNLPHWISGKDIAIRNISVSGIPSNEIIAYLNIQTNGKLDIPKAGTVTMIGDIYENPRTKNSPPLPDVGPDSSLTKKGLEQAIMNNYTFLAREYHV